MSKIIMSESVEKSVERCQFYEGCVTIYKIAEGCDGAEEDFRGDCYYDEILTCKEAYKDVGVYDDDDLRKFYGDEVYEILGGIIRIAFMGVKKNT